MLKYLSTIKHNYVQDFRVAPDGVQSTVPKELVINIDLPLLNAANSVNLEIFEKQLLLESEHPAKYKLDLKLPHRVAENKGGVQKLNHFHASVVFNKSK